MGNSYHSLYYRTLSAVPRDEPGTAIDPGTAVTTAQASRRIAEALAAFLKHGRAGRVYLAGGSTPPPPLAFMVNFPRLSVVLSGGDEMEVEQGGESRLLRLRRGDAVYVPATCWNRPAWSSRVEVLTLLFGKRQTGISLVGHGGRAGGPAGAVKANFHRPLAGPASGILDALSDLPPPAWDKPTAGLLVDAMLFCCLDLLSDPEPSPGGKANRTFQNVCLYVQENLQFPLSRDSVARHFRLSPNHVSRLFRSEGLMKFTDYLTWVRLDRAKYLLLRHDLTVDEVAAGCGFNGTGYFCRIFKRKTKLTPTAYRERSRQGGGGVTRDA